jgi:NADH dehydrogenase/NADH:ubiquinone oxidoreductase subunit G
MQIQCSGGEVSLMINMIIDGKKVEASEGQTILEVAREEGIDIPTLCYHEAVSSAGACRMCVVEAVKGGRSKIVASCLYQVEEGLEVFTKSDRVLDSRRTVIELLLASCPKSEILQNMAAELCVESTSWTADDEDNLCILCGLCVRACDEVVGVDAISLVNRGTKREVSTPFDETSDVCIGCGSCHYICPTGHIKMEDDGGVRKIANWNVEFELAKCKSCGNYFAPKVQLDYIKNIYGIEEDLESCPSCSA